MKIDLTEEDFTSVIPRTEIETRLRGHDEHLAVDSEATIAEFLPKVIAAKLSKHLPEGFQINEIEVNAELAGKVFGCGLSGSLTLKFGPRRPETLTEQSNT